MPSRCFSPNHHWIASRSRSSWASRSASRPGRGAVLTAWTIFSARRRKVGRSPASSRKPTNVPAAFRGLNQHSDCVQAIRWSAGTESASVFRTAKSRSPPASRASLNATLRRTASGWGRPGNQLTEPRRSLISNPFGCINRLSSSRAALNCRSCPTATVWIASIKHSHSRSPYCAWFTESLRYESWQMILSRCLMRSSRSGWWLDLSCRSKSPRAAAKWCPWHRPTPIRRRVFRAGSSTISNILSDGGLRPHIRHRSPSAEVRPSIVVRGWLAISRAASAAFRGALRTVGGWGNVTSGMDRLLRKMNRLSWAHSRHKTQL
jgi:hypothetical protein